MKFFFLTFYKQTLVLEMYTVLHQSRFHYKTGFMYYYDNPLHTEAKFSCPGQPMFRYLPICLYFNILVKWVQTALVGIQWFSNLLSNQAMGVLEAPLSWFGSIFKNRLLNILPQQFLANWRFRGLNPAW